MKPATTVGAVAFLVAAALALAANARLDTVVERSLALSALASLGTAAAHRILARASLTLPPTPTPSPAAQAPGARPARENQRS